MWTGALRAENWAKNESKPVDREGPFSGDYPAPCGCMNSAVVAAPSSSSFVLLRRRTSEVKAAGSSLSSLLSS